MGSGISFPGSSKAQACAQLNGGYSGASEREPRAESSEVQTKTKMDARIVDTLRELNMARRAAPEKVKTMNFQRIVLKFGVARDAFTTIRTLYNTFAKDDGLDFEGLRAVMNELKAEMSESDMKEIFYESDMVRDNSLQHDEFVVSLAISYLLGLISNFHSVAQSIAHAPEDVNWAHSVDDLSARISENSTELIPKALELMVTAYLLFDDDASGRIETNEVRKVMQRQNESKNQLERKGSSLTSRAIRDERIKELDVDKDGTITFQEFVITFQKWVNTDE